MRLLIGHTNQMPELRERRALPGREEMRDDILAFGNGYDQIPHAPKMWWAEILAGCPGGWKPEVYIHWSIEYNPVPEGMESADCFTVGVLGDWNLGGQALHLVAGAFDMLIADRAGMKRLQDAGFTNVYYAPQWAFDPAVHHLYPDVPRDLDIVMVGNFNHEVQVERSRWLARIARLSGKHRVCLTNGVHGEEYARLLNRAKIVFNRSIGGGINMRAYEAPACGAVLFNERDNAEISTIFTDGVDCVLYGEQDLEALLERYLADDAARTRIAEAGTRTVQEHSYALHMTELLNVVDAARKAHPAHARSFLALPAPDRHFRLCWQNMLMGTYPNLLAAEQAMLLAEQSVPESALGSNARAVLLAKFAGCLTNPEERASALRQAIQQARRAFASRPDYVLGRYNLAQIQLALSSSTADMHAMEELEKLLSANALPAEAYTGPVYSQHFGAFNVELERVWGEHRPGTPAWTEGMRTLLLWRIREQMSDLEFEARRFPEAAALAANAIPLQPQVATAYYRYARALAHSGRLGLAEQNFQQALQRMPLYPEVWIELAMLLKNSGQWLKCRSFLDEIREILAASPFYAQCKPVIEALRAEVASGLPASTPVRLLAIPEWNEPSEWKPLIRGYVEQYGSEEAVVLLTIVDPARHPDLQTLLASLKQFVQSDLGMSAENIPGVTLVTDHGLPGRASLPEADIFLRLHGGGDQSPPFGIPVLPLEDLACARTILHNRSDRQ